MELEKELTKALVTLQKADKNTLLERVGKSPEANRAIGKLIERGDFRITLDWQLAPGRHLKREE